MPRPGMAEARSRGPRAWPLADRPRPGALSNRNRRRRRARPCAAVCVAVIAAVMAKPGREGLDTAIPRRLHLAVANRPARRRCR